MNEDEPIDLVEAEGDTAGAVDKIDDTLIPDGDDVLPYGLGAGVDKGLDHFFAKRGLHRDGRTPLSKKYNPRRAFHF